MVEGGWKVASFNIRMKTQEPDPNDNWDFRKDALLQELVNSQAAIIGLQEG
jgi:mRNA deadenylase 3'-5' endonuclease subunit Ccr4